MGRVEIGAFYKVCSGGLIFTTGIVIGKPSEYVANSTLASFIAKCSGNNSAAYYSAHSRNIVENIRDHHVTC